MNAILFGFKGCGKTYFGKLLAQELKRPFVDTDDLVNQLYWEKTSERLSNSAIFQKIGENAFRLLETESILSLREFQEGVIALGGGTVLSPLNRQLLSPMGTSIYLETSLEALQNRGTTHIAGPIEILYRERLPIYQSILAPRVQIDLLDEQEVIAALCKILEKSYAC